MRRRDLVAIIALAVATSCAKPPSRLTVAAAANLTDVFEQIGKAFTAETGIEVAFSYGPTATLARQVEEKAPFDVFAAADKEHVDALEKSGRIVAGTNGVYARGQLALWSPRAGIDKLEALRNPSVKYVAIAQPDLAPYGRASVETLKASGLWDAVQPKIVYANNINEAKQFAATGNADAAFTAYSLVLHETGSVLKVDPKLFAPIEQATGVIAGSGHEAEARRFVEFLMGPKGGAILTQNGYLR